MKRSLVGSIFLMVFVGAIAAQVADRDRGIELYRSGSYPEASQSLSKAVDSDDKDKLAWMYLGGSLQREGKTAEASKAFEKAIGLKAFDPDCEASFKFINRARPNYTDDARENNEIGTVWTAVEFLPDGKFGFMVPVRKLGFGLTESSVSSIKRSKFSPGTKDGKPIPCIRMISTTFTVY